MGADRGAAYFRGTEHVSPVCPLAQGKKGPTMSRVLYRIGHFAGRHPWRVLAAWVLIAVTAFLLNSSIGGAPDESFSLPGAESQRAADAIEARFPQETLNTSNVVFHDEDGLTQPAVKAAVQEAVTQLAEGKHVIDVADPYDPRGPTVSQDGTTAFATVAFDTQEIGPEDFKAAEEAVQVARDAGVQVEYDQGLGLAADDAAPGSEQLGILVAVVVLAIAFGSLVAMSLPIVVALVGLLVGLSSIGLLSGVLAVPQIATIVAMMMGLGVGIDYALFILARHRQTLESGATVPEAIGRANATAGLSVLFAGTTVVLAIAGLQVSGIPMMTMMGWASALMVAIVMVAAVTLLPALLGIAGKRVNSLRVPFIKQKPANNPQSKSARWTAKVVAKPVRYGAVAAIILAILAIPTFSMRLGFPDAGNDTAGSTTREAYDLMADKYGAGVNGPLAVVVETHSSPKAAAVIGDLTEGIAADKGVASVDEPTFSPKKDLAIINLTPTTAPQDAKTSALLDRLRTDVIPAAVGDTAFTPDGRGDEQHALQQGRLARSAAAYQRDIARVCSRPHEASLTSVIRDLPACRPRPGMSKESSTGESCSRRTEALATGKRRLCDRPCQQRSRPSRERPLRRSSGWRKVEIKSAESRRPVSVQDTASGTDRSAFQGGRHGVR